jgi:hypothetical protein
MNTRKTIEINIIKYLSTLILFLIKYMKAIHNMIIKVTVLTGIKKKEFPGKANSKMKKQKKYSKIDLSFIDRTLHFSSYSFI